MILLHRAFLGNLWQSMTIYDNVLQWCNWWQLMTIYNNLWQSIPFPDWQPMTTYDNVWQLWLGWLACVGRLDSLGDLFGLLNLVGLLDLLARLARVTLSTVRLSQNGYGFNSYLLKERNKADHIGSTWRHLDQLGPTLAQLGAWATSERNWREWCSQC